MAQRSLPRLAHALATDRSGVAMLEFALMLPLFLGFVLTGIEVANYVLANNRTQRLAAMTADLVSQSGVGTIGATEGEMYDLFSAIDLTAQPFDIRNHGRVVITSVKGTDNNNDRAVENRILWQRFDGNYLSAVPLLGCNEITEIATMPNARTLPLNEILFHVQVSYNYQPVFSSRPFKWVQLPTEFTRTAMFRARSTQFQSPSPDNNFPPKKKCSTADGL
jgi:Flp pilus assembly protein TadG